MQMEEWKARLLAERNELRDRLMKLHYFIDGEFDKYLYLKDTDKRLLCDQRDLMEKYLTILNRRVAIAGMDIGND